MDTSKARWMGTKPSTESFLCSSWSHWIIVFWRDTNNRAITPTWPAPSHRIHKWCRMVMGPVVWTAPHICKPRSPIALILARWTRVVTPQTASPKIQRIRRTRWHWELWKWWQVEMRHDLSISMRLRPTTKRITEVVNHRLEQGKTSTRSMLYLTRGMRTTDITAAWFRNIISITRSKEHQPATS